MPTMPASLYLWVPQNPNTQTHSIQQLLEPTQVSFPDVSVEQGQHMLSQVHGVCAETQECMSGPLKFCVLDDCLSQPDPFPGRMLQKERRGVVRFRGEGSKEGRKDPCSVLRPSSGARPLTAFTARFPQLSLLFYRRTRAILLGPEPHIHPQDTFQVMCNNYSRTGVVILLQCHKHYHPTKPFQVLILVTMFS